MIKVYLNLQNQNYITILNHDMIFVSILVKKKYSFSNFVNELSLIIGLDLMLKLVRENCKRVKRLISKCEMYIVRLVVKAAITTA